MKREAVICLWVLLVGLAIALIGFPSGDTVQAAEPKTGGWTGGGALGFLANTPDDTALALNVNADRFLNRNVSIGPLLQLGFTGDLAQVGFSGQGKYWLDIPDTVSRAKLVLQSGLGFVHADLHRSDTSWLIPLGLGLDYQVDETIALTSTFLLNFTDLDTGPRTHTNVMPGLTLGLRF